MVEISRGVENCQEMADMVKDLKERIISDLIIVLGVALCIFGSPFTIRNEGVASGGGAPTCH